LAFQKFRNANYFGIRIALDNILKVLEKTCVGQIGGPARERIFLAGSFLLSGIRGGRRNCRAGWSGEIAARKARKRPGEAAGKRFDEGCGRA
jgi:hypothetical protein